MRPPRQPAWQRLPVLRPRQPRRLRRARRRLEQRPHNFSIDELGIDIDIAPGETQETVINAPAGEYEFYCNVPGHKEAGMVGTLIVTEGAVAATPAENGSESAATPAAAAPTGGTPATGSQDQAAGQGSS